MADSPYIIEGCGRSDRHTSATFRRAAQESPYEPAGQRTMTKTDPKVTGPGVPATSYQDLRAPPKYFAEHFI
jgi:hypothetical protein